MDLHRLRLLDDHILVLRDLLDVLSVEIKKAEEEKQLLLESMGMTEREDGETLDNSETFSRTTKPEKELEEEFSGVYAERSVTPTSTLCCLQIEGSEVTDEAFDERRTNCGMIVDNAGHANKMPFSEDLPTPRLVACLDHTMVVVSDEVNPDPDMNNALADSDDDETSTDSQGGNSHPDSALAEEDGKMSRPRSSLNNGENDSDTEEEDGTKPHCWISNSVYTSGIVDMIKGKESSQILRNEDANATTPSASSSKRTTSEHLNFDCFPLSTKSDNTNNTISLRSYDNTLMEKAASAVKMSNDIKRMKVELLDREAHIEFLYERHHKLKEASKKELQRRERESRELRSQMDAATSSKFITFCKLQSAEARVAELEKLLGSICENKQRDVSTSDSCDRAEVPTDGVVNLDISSHKQRRSHEQQFLSESLHKGIDSTGHHPLQDTLRQTYARLLEAEKRGDELRHRVQQLEKKTTVTKKRVTTATKTQSQKGSSTPSKKSTPKNKRTASLDTTKPSTTAGHARSKSVQKSTGSASSNALRSKHDRSSHRCVSEANPASRLSKPIRWSS